MCLLGHDIDKWDFVIARHDDEAREIFSKMQEYYNECPEDYTITPLPNTIMSSYIQSVKFDDVPEVQLQLQINDLV